MSAFWVRTGAGIPVAIGISLAEQMDEVGFWAVEVWGGATFVTMHRFLAEDPWERPKTLKRYIKKTPFSMLLRGQNLVGYRNYPDDVAKAFVDKACEVGIDVFRIFDALNDLRNFNPCMERVKAEIAPKYSSFLSTNTLSVIKGKTPITGRPADFIEPELAEAKRKIGDLAKNEEDPLTYALYPTTGEEFLKRKYGWAGRADQC